MRKNNFSIVIQIRNGSSRLPGKALLKYKKITLIEIMLRRLLSKFKNNQVYLITTNLKQDDILIEICKKLKIKTYRGYEDNVLKRYIKTASLYKIKNIVRLTGDCPLVDPALIKKMLKYFFLKKLDYYSNCYPYTERFFPVGSDVEIIKTKVLRYLYKTNPSSYEKEHVTTKVLKYYLKFKCEIFKTKKNFSKLRYTLDYYKDYKVIIKILKYFNKKKIFGTCMQIVNFLLKNPNLIKYNEKYVDIYYKKKIID